MGNNPIAQISFLFNSGSPVIFLACGSKAYNDHISQAMWSRNKFDMKREEGAEPGCVSSGSLASPIARDNIQIQLPGSTLMRTANK